MLTNSSKYKLLKNNYRLDEIKKHGYTPEKYIADPINLETLLKNLVAKGLRKEKISYLFASEVLDMTEKEVKTLI